MEFGDTVPEGSGRQEKMERHCCNVICGAPTTAEVKGLRRSKSVVCQQNFN